MRRVLEWFGRHGTLLLPLSVLLGLAWPDLARLFRPLLAPAVFALLVIVMTRVNLDAVMRHVRRPLVPLLALAWMLIAVPLIFAALIVLFDPSPGLKLGLVFWASSPPIFSSAALAYLLGLDGALALGLLMVAILLHPLTTPLFTELLIGEAVRISGIDLALRLAVLIGGAAAVAIAARRFLGPERQRRWGIALDGLNVLTMIAFVIGLMDGIAGQLLARPAFALALGGFVFALHLAMNAAAAALFWRSGRRRAATIGLCNGGRNIAMAVGVLGAAAPADTWLFFAVIQFPIYLLPMLLKPIYARLIEPGAG
jgi:predicted Na+-dependent transporter